MVTAEEFFDPKNGYLTQEFVDDLLPEIKETFIQVVNNYTKYNYIIFDGSSRTGKSLLVKLIAKFFELQKTQFFICDFSEIQFDFNNATEHMINEIQEKVKENIVIIIGNPRHIQAHEFIQKLKLLDKSYYRHFSRVGLRKNLFPKYMDTGETFRVFIGNGIIPAFIVPKDITENEQNLLISLSPYIKEVPIDVLEDFNFNLHAAITDILGEPCYARR